MGFAELLTAADRATQRHLGGVTVVYQPAGGGAVEVQGVFDEPYRLHDQAQVGVESTEPAVSLALSDLPVHPDDDDPIITIGGVSYRKRTVEPDSLGKVVRITLALLDVD